MGKVSVGILTLQVMGGGEGAREGLAQGHWVSNSAPAKAIGVVLCVWLSLEGNHDL